MQASDVKVPIDVAPEHVNDYIENILTVTQNSGKIMLFAGDQKVEHLNEDFYGEGISEENANPEHLFEIASKARIGAFATQFGLIAKYGGDYKDTPYIVKMNAKTNLVPTSQKDPRSLAWLHHGDVLELKRTSGLNIVGIGYTVYLGSEYEADMLREAASLVYAARYFGLISILWMYPRGKAVTNEKDPKIVAGATGVAAALGTDFAKVNAPKAEGMSSAEALKQAVEAAGRTKVICAGGGHEDVPAFLQSVYDQIHVGGAGGNATGRNIHQRSLDEAVRFCNAISAITFDDKSVADAVAIYNGN